MYEEVTKNTIEKYLVDNIFRGKIGVSVFEDSVSLLSIYPGAKDELEQIRNIIQKGDVYTKLAILELKIKHTGLPIRHQGRRQKFVDLFNSLSKSRQNVKIVVAGFLVGKEIDISSPELDGSGNWVKSDGKKQS